MVRHTNKERAHPHHTLVIRVNKVSTSGNLGTRIVMVEKSCQPPIQDIWKLFTRLYPMASSEEELIGMMNQEVPGLGEVAQVLGTHGDTTREETVWEVLEFFMNDQIGLPSSPRLAWEDKNLRAEVLRLAKISGGSIGSI